MSSDLTSECPCPKCDAAQAGCDECGARLPAGSNGICGSCSGGALPDDIGCAVCRAAGPDPLCAECARARGVTQAGEPLSSSEAADSFPPADTIDLVAEGQALAEILASLAKLHDRSKGRVLGVVIDLAQTGGPFAQVQTWQSRSAERLARLRDLFGTGPEDDEDDGAP